MAHSRFAQCLLSALIVLLLNPLATLAQPWSGVVAPDRAIDRSSAGVNGGIPTRTTVWRPALASRGLQLRPLL